MKRNTGRMMAMVVALVLGIAVGFASPVPFGVDGVKARPETLKIRYGSHVYSFWKVGNDIVAWDTAGQRIPDFLTLKEVVTAYSLARTMPRIPAIHVPGASLEIATVDWLARNSQAGYRMIDRALGITESPLPEQGFYDALEHRGISDKDAIERIIAKATWFRRDPVTVEEFRNELKSLSESSRQLAAAWRKLDGELRAGRPFRLIPDKSVLEYDADVLGPIATFKRLVPAVSDYAAAMQKFDKAVQVFFANAIDEDADVPAPTDSAPITKVMYTLYGLHQDNITREAAGVAAALDHAFRVAAAQVEQAELLATKRGERARSVVTGFVDRKLVSARRFLLATERLHANFQKLEMDPRGVFYTDERSQIQTAVKAVEEVLEENPSLALERAERTRKAVEELVAEMPGEHIRALQGKLSGLMKRVDEGTRVRAEENMDKALVAFERHDGIEALTALAVTTDALAAGSKVPMVSALTGEPMVDKDDMRVTVVPPPAGDNFQNPWFLGLVSAALLFPLLVLLYVVRRLAARTSAGREETTMGIPEEATRLA